ncbi:peptidoglycan-binding protein [Streptomyces hirsutus]|uniref:Peptidoglycan-binding protein n=1 Tax=Streptomyces hirsutus TaxID=35620 RepID=A0ABZ1GSG0_9ACTN|nr:peptidoglycan-binding protein [Streptomyces hirsutus]WSD08140.1 peptidoglycan-binding protein [Streptomyces hirsutus]
MSRWKGLPTELDPSVRNLVVRLRRLKDHSGLSLRQLAAKTGYSSSSWERYLGGRALPPRDAVEALASVTGEEPTRLLAVWEVAAEAWSGRTATAPAGPIAGAAPAGARDQTPESAAEPGRAESLEPLEPLDPIGPAGPGAEPARGRAFHVAVAAGAVAVVLAVSAVVVLVDRAGADRDHGAVAPLAPSAAPAASPRSVPAYTCRVERIDGLWHAGLSTTRDKILANGYAGPEVAEAQCLLDRAGYSPGDVDGIFGPMTERAVKRLQTDADLVVDGIVGPHTWGALRR